MTSAGFKRSSVAVAVTSALLFAGSARAATLSATYLGLAESGSTPAGTLNGNALPSGNSGLFLFQATSVPAGVTLIEDTDPGTDFLAICLEPVEFISGSGPYTWNYTTTGNAPVDAANSPNVPMSSQNRQFDLARLLNGAMPVWDSNANIGGSAPSGLRALALQLAVWEIANEDKTTFGYDLSTGDFKITNIAAGSAAALAQTFLSNVGTVWNSADNTFYRALTWDNQQDFVIKITRDGETTVPIPAAAWLLGSGLLGLFGLGRRRQTASAD